MCEKKTKKQEAKNKEVSDCGRKEAKILWSCASAMGLIYLAHRSRLFPVPIWLLVHNPEKSGIFGRGFCPSAIDEFRDWGHNHTGHETKDDFGQGNNKRTGRTEGHLESLK